MKSERLVGVNRMRVVEDANVELPGVEVRGRDEFYSWWC